jgi:hypothetical protein
MALEVMHQVHHLEALQWVVMILMLVTLSAKGNCE